MIRHACGVALALAVRAVVASAQAPAARPQPEFRLDATDGRPAAVQALAGAILPVGNYLRVTVSAGGGVARGEDGDGTTGSFRGESTVRFLLDPYRESRVGLSAGGGITVRHEPEFGTRAYLALLLDIEGRPRGHFAPAVQLGLGGGARVAVVLRGLSPRRR